MFDFSDEKLLQLKAIHTVREISNQPRLWKTVLENYKNEKSQIGDFLEGLKKKYGKIRVIFTGAGTSAYVGNTILSYLLSLQDDTISFESIATTDIVSNPKQYLRNVPTLMVSFARSGNSPESVSAVNLANKFVDEINHMAITCAKDGKLAIDLSGKDNAYVMLMPDESNDKGFAMTSSFTCMMLSALMIFDKANVDEQKFKIVEDICSMAQEVIKREDELHGFIDTDFDRIVYLGSGCLGELTREAQLKILELTAGKVSTCFDSSMGFRHGPKSFVNGNTIVFDFVSSDEYTRKYDVDIVNEINQDGITKKVVAITDEKLSLDVEQFAFNSGKNIPDIYLAFAYVVIAQSISVMASIKVGNTPDTPSATGTVNRVVKGVIIHDID